MKLYIYVQHLSHAYFYLGLFNHLPHKNIVVFTENISLYYTIKYQKKFKRVFHKVYLIPRFKEKRTEVCERELELRELKILNYIIQYFRKSPEEAKSEYLFKVKWIADRITEKSLGFCWSGNKSEPLAFAKAIMSLSGVVIFGEITNFPQTVYMDTKGTNFYSSIRDQYIASANNEDIPDETFKSKLLKLKTEQKKIPQSNLKKIIKFYFFISGIQNFLMRNGARFHFLKILKDKIIINLFMKQFISQLIKKGEWIDLNNFNIPVVNKTKYSILVPLQVYSDTQLHVFSRFKSPMDYIKFIISIIDSNMEVHFKLHPAEKNKYNKIIKKIISSVTKKYPNIKLVDNIDLLNYDAIATINSTFGIDGLLRNIKIISFGESLYSGFDFALSYSDKYVNLRYAIETYNEHVNPEKFNLFSKIIYENFYHFNYFGDSDITKNISNDLFEKSISRLLNKIVEIENNISYSHLN